MGVNISWLKFSLNDFDIHTDSLIFVGNTHVLSYQRIIFELIDSYKSLIICIAWNANYYIFLVGIYGSWLFRANFQRFYPFEVVTVGIFLFKYLIKWEVVITCSELNRYKVMLKFILVIFISNNIPMNFDYPGFSINRLGNVCIVIYFTICRSLKTLATKSKKCKFAIFEHEDDVIHVV